MFQETAALPLLDSVAIACTSLQRLWLPAKPPQIGGGQTCETPPFSEELLAVNSGWWREVLFFSSVATGKFPCLVNNPSRYHTQATQIKHTHTLINMHTHTYTSTHTHARLHTLSDTHACMHTYVHSYAHITHTGTQHSHMHVLMHTHTHMHAYMHA